MKENYKNYKRRPIHLGEHTIAVIRLYSRTDYLEDCFTINLKQADLVMEPKDYKESARQFVYQLEGRWNGLFIEALIKELIKHRNEYYNRQGKSNLYERLNKWIKKHKKENK